MKVISLSWRKIHTMKWIDTHVHIGRFHNTRYLAGDLAPLWKEGVAEAWCSSLSGATVSMRYGNDSPLRMVPNGIGLTPAGPFMTYRNRGLADLADAVPDAKARKKILRENPERLLKREEVDAGKD